MKSNIPAKTEDMFIITGTVEEDSNFVFISEHSRVIFSKVDALSYLNEIQKLNPETSPTIYKLSLATELMTANSLTSSAIN